MLKVKVIDDATTTKKLLVNIPYYLWTTEDLFSEYPNTTQLSFPFTDQIGGFQINEVRFEFEIGKKTTENVIKTGMFFYLNNKQLFSNVFKADNTVQKFGNYLSIEMPIKPENDISIRAWGVENENTIIELRNINVYITIEKQVKHHTIKTKDSMMFTPPPSPPSSSITEIVDNSNIKIKRKLTSDEDKKGLPLYVYFIIIFGVAAVAAGIYFYFKNSKVKINTITDKTI